jgi:CRP/FNR family cyclic AMP-dependent transcriptional regulator
MDHIAKFLKNVPLFAGLSESELEAITRSGTHKPFARNAQLIQQGADGGSLFVVLRGKVKVVLADSEGREITLSLMHPGDFVGEMALIDDEPRSASVMAVEATDCFVLSRREFQNCLTGNANLAFNLMKGLCRRLRATDNKVGDLALRDVYQRVVHTLNQLSRPDRDRHVIPERISQQEIANMVGASREMVNRVLRDLTQSGRIEIDDGQIVIRNHPADATR